MSEQLTLFTEDTHASRFHPRALEEVKRTLVTSGRILCDSLGNSGPLGLLERMLLGTYPSAWMPCCTIWRVQRTPRGRSVFRLELSERPTADTESSWLPTMTINGNYNRKGSSPASGDGLATVLGGPPNPTWIEWFMGFPMAWSAVKPSVTQ